MTHDPACYCCLSGLYVGGEKFSEFGGNMKAWYNDFVVPNHWVKAVKREPYLLE